MKKLLCLAVLTISLSVSAAAAQPSAPIGKIPHLLTITPNTNDVTVAGYYFYWCTNSFSGTQRIAISTNQVNNFDLSLFAISQGSSYWFSVTATNTTGGESDGSPPKQWFYSKPKVIQDSNITP